MSKKRKRKQKRKKKNVPLIFYKRTGKTLKKKRRKSVPNEVWGKNAGENFFARADFRWSNKNGGKIRERGVLTKTR